ncbi:carbohydrate-binding protein [Streptomyces malaysiensis]|nr:hypothetical protein R8789_15620 [Streptomyces malaysiensis]
MHLATAAVPPTGGPYAYATVRADLPTPPTGVRTSRCAAAA